MGRPATGLNLLVDREGQGVARRVVAVAARLAVAVQEFFAQAVEQTAAQLDARRLPSRRIEPDHARGQVAVRIELQELDVDDPRAGAQREANALPGEIV